MKTTNKEHQETIENFYSKMKSLETHYFGFPNNMAYDYEDVSKISGVYINNAGDPFSTLSWKKHSKFFEQEVVNYFMDLYKLPRKLGWGYMTSGGTEGNMEGLFLAREAYPTGICYVSADAHYSIEKICRILRTDVQMVKSQKNGEMDYKDFERLVKKNKNRPPIIVVNCGTTIKGAFDNLDKIQNILKKNHVKEKYIHVDGALSGMITPFVKKSPFYSFDKGIDSIAISMHKFFGCPIMSGIVIARFKHVEGVKQKIEYINSHDTTISGSRNGQVPVYVWHIIKKYGNEFKKDANQCLENAKYLRSKLEDKGYKAYLNEYSNTVYMDRPSDDVIDKWQLSCYQDIAHVVVMQHVTKEKIDQFVEEVHKENHRKLKLDNFAIMTELEEREGFVNMIVNRGRKFLYFFLFIKSFFS